MRNIFKKIPIAVACLTTMVACNNFETDLNVENLEHPNDNILTSDPIALQATAATIYQNWYMANSTVDNIGPATNTMADVSSCSWGNFGMRDLSSEPRVAFDNSPSYGNESITSVPFNAYYSVLSDANTLALAVANGTEFENSNLILTIAKFGQALTLGYNALNFDKVWLSDENGPVGDGEATEYKEAMDFALQKLDEAIAIASSNEFDVPETWFPGNSMTSADLAKLMNTYGARMLVMNVRNTNEKNALDWNKVASYASAGITSDFAIFHDDVNWYDLFKTYLVYPGWARIDLRVINLMDPNYPAYWPDGETILPPAESLDARLETDFAYLNSQSFRPERGTYHYSSYRYSRYDNYITNWVVPTEEATKSENDLYHAEALLNLGDAAGAADIINAGTRVTRGGLAPVAVDQQAVADAIHYERMVEMPILSSGLSFYEMRKEDLLQAGTLLHFPVPGKALEAIPAPNYTFGGTTGEAGVDYSTGGWR